MTLCGDRLEKSRRYSFLLVGLVDLFPVRSQRRTDSFKLSPEIVNASRSVLRLTSIVLLKVFKCKEGLQDRRNVARVSQVPNARSVRSKGRLQRLTRLHNSRVFTSNFFVDVEFDFGHGFVSLLACGDVDSP